MLIGIFYSQIVESSSLVSVLFISFFQLLVNGFSVIIHRAASLHHNGLFYSQLSFVRTYEKFIYIVYEMGREKVLVKLLQLPSPRGQMF